MATMVKWPSIGHLHNVKKTVDHWEAYCKEKGESYSRPAVAYRAKVKLDGTNAAVQITPDGEILAQSHTRFVTPDRDNHGWAHWVDLNSQFLKSIRETFFESELPITIFGEWCGKGIQKGCSISKIDRQIFAIFAIQTGRSDADDCCLYTSPAAILNLLPRYLPSGMVIIPWHDDIVVMNFGNTEALQRTADEIVSAVTSVEECDPLVKSLFNVEGLGEGLVFYPSFPVTHRNKIASFMFKAKGEKHAVVKQKRVVIVDPELVATVEAFTEKFVTENRLQQGLTDGAGNDASMQQLGNFLKWVGQDIKKESQDELTASDLEWKQVSKQVNTKARGWFIRKVEEL